MVVLVLGYALKNWATNWVESDKTSRVWPHYLGVYSKNKDKSKLLC